MTVQRHGCQSNPLANPLVPAQAGTYDTRFEPWLPALAGTSGLEQIRPPRSRCTT